MVNFLAIETTTEACSVALAVNNTILTRYSSKPRGHAQELIPFVESLLQEASITMPELDAIGVSVGPGSFTGIRIGVSVAQGFAFGSGKPVVTASTMELLALKAYRLERTERVMVALDAKMGECFVASFIVNSHATVTTLNDIQLVKVEHLSYDSEVEGIVTCGLGSLPNCAIPQYAMMPDAYDLIPLGLKRFLAGLHQMAEHVEPLYVRNHVAQMSALNA